ncbi:MAG: hypothetical protein OXI01_05970 [Albidovulum sp.]|nr:hypothetical protein [Albidovulum sp.]
MQTSFVLWTIAIVAAIPALADDPLSAIDWLEGVEDEDSLEIEVIRDAGAGPDYQPAIEAAELEALRWDAVGLVSSELSGLPKDLWQESESSAIEQLFAELNVDLPPAALELLYTLLLAEADPPGGSASDGSLFLTRVDKLIELGALEHAEALLERAGPTEPEAFRRWFDISLLTGYENRACAAMSSVPALAPSFSARLFCLVREGHWSAAAVSHSAARAIGMISPSEAEPLKYFLYPELIGGNAIPETNTLTPLAFRMLEAIGQPPASSILPLAYIYRHHSGIMGWKSKIEAGERLARSGAIPPGSLFSAYLERPPPASGGIWDRVNNVQALDLALLSANSDEVEQLVPTIFDSMRDVGLEVAFSRYFGPRIIPFGASGGNRPEAFYVALLSDEYVSASQQFTTATPRELFLQSIAAGTPSWTHARTPLELAIAAALTGTGFDGELEDLLERKKLGEALLRSLYRFSHFRHSDPFDVGEALFALVQSGFRSEATRIALQMLVAMK